MKLVSVLALVALVVSCHIDKLLKGGGTPPSDAPPARVAFSSPPSSARADEPINPPVQVTVRDSAGHVTLRDTLVILSLGANPSGDSLRGDTLAHSVNGVATFVNVRLDKAASGYRLTAAAPELHPDTSPAFSVMPAPATVLAFTVQPTDAMQGSAIKPVEVTAYDALGNTATTFTGPIPLAFASDGSGSKNATLSGGAPVNAVSGVATFPNLRIDKAGTGYTLRATAPPLTDATSSAFAVRAPPSGSLRVTTSTSGDNPDTDGYTATVDGTTSQSIASNSSTGVTFTGLSVSSHTVELTGVAANCTVSGGASHTVNVTDGQTTTEPFSISCTATTGTLNVTTSTSGGSPDPNGYTFTVDGGASQPLQANQTIPLTGVSATSHTVDLGDVAGNCTVTGGTSRTVTVPAGGSVTASFVVSCPTPTGTLNVTTSTSGGSPDPNGYTFTVDGGASQAIQTNQTIPLTVTAASHTVELGDVAGNCTVTGGTSRTVTVPAGGSATASFVVSCPTPTGTLNVTTSTSGGSPDPNGYTFTVDGGASQPIQTNQTIPLTGVSATSHTVDLGDIAGNCTVTGGTSRTVTVPAGGSVTASFVVSCPTATGTLNVTTSTSGGSPDPNGYTFTVDGGASQAIQTNQTIPLTVTAASHTVELGDVAGNCTVTGGTSRTVTVPAGGSATASFVVSCPTPTGTLNVTTSTSGGTPDPDGYTVSVT